MSDSRADRGALLDAILTRAADQLGDLTEPVMQRFYRDFGDAKALFEHHGLGKRERLEAEMVETALYSVMTWVERPMEVAIMLYGSVPHHRNTLHVQPEWYCGLLNALIDLLAETIPTGAAAEEQLLAEIRAGLLNAIAESLAAMAPQSA
jgi:hypothetical protein